MQPRSAAYANVLGDVVVRHGRFAGPAIGCDWSTAVRRFWVGSFSFQGRSSRSEFWWIRATDVAVVVLTLWLVPLLTGVPADSGENASYQNVPGFLGIGQSIFGVMIHEAPAGSYFGPVTFLLGGPPSQWVLLIWCIATLVPNLALGFRRLQDRDLPGWYALLGFLPLVDLVLLYLALGRSRPYDPRMDHTSADQSRRGDRVSLP